MAEADLARSRRQAEQTVVLAEAESQEQRAGRPRRAQKDCASRFVGGGGAAAEDFVVRQPEVVRDVASGGAVVEEQAAAGAGTRLYGGRQWQWKRRWHARHPASGLFGMLISLLVAEKAGFAPEKANSSPQTADVEAFADRVTKKILDAAENGAGSKRARCDCV